MQMGRGALSLPLPVRLFECVDHVKFLKRITAIGLGKWFQFHPDSISVGESRTARTGVYYLTEQLEGLCLLREENEERNF
jgi:hypothetical protein